MWNGFADASVRWVHVGCLDAERSSIFFVFGLDAYLLSVVAGAGNRLGVVAGTTHVSPASKFIMQIMFQPILASSDPMSHVLPHRMSESLPEWFTNHTFMVLVAATVTGIVLVRMGRRVMLETTSGTLEGMVPKGSRNLVESIMQYLRNEVVRPILGDDTDRFIPFLWTLFFFILICNLLGLVPLDPFFQIISGGRLKHFGGTATSGLSVTSGLAIIAFLVIQGSGIWEITRKLWKGIDLHSNGHHDETSAQVHHAPHPIPLPLALTMGFVLYWWNFAPHVFKPQQTKSLKDAALWGVDIVFWMFMLVIETIGALVKPFALAMRLFANMMAGHVVLASLLIMIPAVKSIGAVAIAVPTLLGCVGLSCLELFVALLQAYIFVFLTCLFINFTVHPEH